jgi:hypothetical protein
LANELIDEGAVALTAAERLLDGKQLLLKVHRPTNTPDVDPRIRSLCDGIEEVRIEGERFAFDYVIDPDPPHSFGYAAFYVAEWLGSKAESAFSAVSLEEGIGAIVSNSA